MKNEKRDRARRDLMFSSFFWNANLVERLLTVSAAVDS